MKFNKNRKSKEYETHREENDYLVVLRDGGILNIETDEDCYPGCETCDYGSQYIREYTITLSNGYLILKAERMYDYPLSEGYMMKTMLSHIDTIKSLYEREFISWMEERINTDMNSSKIDTPAVSVRFEQNV